LKYPEFRFVDLAINGATRRNHIYELHDLPIPINSVDTYTTMFRFREEYKLHVDSTKSVRGASKFECWSDYLWFDIDASDLQDATIDMQTLLRGIKSMGVLEHTIVFFSGSKGYHVGIDSGVFGFKPSINLPNEMRRVCIQIASLFNVEIDTKIYNHNRLWRIPNSVHSKTNLYKTAIDTVIAMNLAINDIKKIASCGENREILQYITCDNTSSIDSLVRLSHEANAGTVKKSIDWDTPPLSDKRAKIINISFEYLLTQGVDRGNRDNEALLRASECRKLEYTEDDCLTKLLQWNKLNRPPLLAPDLERVVSSAYNDAGYDFGTNHNSLRIAREYAANSVNDIDVDALLNADSNAKDDDKYKRRGRTVTELLASGANMEMPEIVGEYFSWRKRITLLVGREKLSGKSTICTFEAIAALRKGYRVLWVSPDEPREDILFRLVQAGIAEDSDNCIIAGDMDVPQGWSELGQLIVDAKPDIVFLDSIHSIFPMLNTLGKIPDSSESAEWQKLVSKLRPLAIELNAAIVWLHHANKGTGLSTGSIGITAAVDAIVTMTPTRKENRRILTFLGRRVNSSFNCALDYMGEQEGYTKAEDWSNSAQHENDNKSKMEQAIDWFMSDFISECIEDTFTRNEAVEAFRDYFKIDPSIKGSVFPKMLSQMRNIGLIDNGVPGPVGVVGASKIYRILDKGTPASSVIKASDLTKGENDDKE